MNPDHAESAGRALDRAAVAMEANLNEQALSEVRQALHLDPERAEGRILQARVLLKTQQPRLALAALDAHDQYNPQQRDDPSVAMLRVEALAGAGQERLALTVTRRLLCDWPDDVRLNRMAAALAMHLDEHDQAESALHRLRGLDSTDGASTRLLAQLYEQRDPQRGFTLMADQARGRDEAGLSLRTARLARQAGRLREAEDRYRQLLDQAADQPIVWQEAGEVADELGEAALALRRLREAVAKGGSEQAQSRQSLARAAMHVGQLREAAWQWWRLTRLAQSDGEAWAGLAVCGQQLDRPKLTQQAHARLAACSNHARRRELLAGHWQATTPAQVVRKPIGTSRSALTELLAASSDTLQQAQRDHPDRADVHYHLANCEAARHHREAAQAAVAEALRINPGYEEAQNLQAALCA
jgi:predicted Zn-dependent protease